MGRCRVSVTSGPDLFLQSMALALLRLSMKYHGRMKMYITVEPRFIVLDAQFYLDFGVLSLSKMFTKPDRDSSGKEK